MVGAERHSPNGMGALYAIVPLREPAPSALAHRINEMAAKTDLLLHDSYAPQAWFVWFPGTAKELSDALGVQEGGKGSTIVMAVTSFHGYASRDLWDWLSLHAG